MKDLPDSKFKAGDVRKVNWFAGQSLIMTGFAVPNESNKEEKAVKQNVKRGKK